MRRKAAEKRYLVGDPKYKDVLVSKFVNNLMLGGKKSKAYHIFYSSIGLVEERAKRIGLEGTGIDIWKKALENVAPQVEVKSRRVGGATLQVPRSVRPARSLSLSIKWLIRFARLRNEKSMMQKLTGEILQAANGEGNAVKKKTDTHRMAEANKAFSHYRN